VGKSLAMIIKKRYELGDFFLSMVDSKNINKIVNSLCFYGKHTKRMANVRCFLGWRLGDNGK
jgi:hypothetical protein